MNAFDTDVLPRLKETVVQYSISSYILRDDLRRLDVVYRAETPEAVILYAGRTLEALARQALRQINQSPSVNVFSNLQLLEHLNRIDLATTYWAHTLRRLGNAVRHILAPVSFEDACLAMVLVERWLDWYFCRFSHGARLEALTTDGNPVDLGGPSDLRKLVMQLEQLAALGSSAYGGNVGRQMVGESLFHLSSALPAVLIEALVSHGDMATAWEVLDGASARFPMDLRLAQLRGLYSSRVGDLDEALSCLMELQQRSPQDDETIGILAGVHKRKWQKDCAATHDLEQSYRGYREGWRRSSKKNAYLGINVATTALWLGHHEESQKLAKEIITLLEERASALPADLQGDTKPFAFWDQLTLAEAMLLSGDHTKADAVYQQVSDAYPNRQHDLQVAMRQREDIQAAQR